jgi:signal transduction histidine kinase
LVVKGSALRLSDELLGLLGQLAGTETRERSVLAEVIHDEPIQLIVAAILRVDLLQAHSTGAAADELEKIATLLESSVDRLRRLIVALSPPDLSDGLGSALRVLADGIFIDATTQFQITGPMHVRLSPAAEDVVFRIFREAMVNARKHSSASNVRLHLDPQDGAFVVTLTDDGVGSVGFDLDIGNLGTATMRARAKVEGGRLRIKSKPGLGTIVELTLPVVAQP